MRVNIWNQTAAILIVGSVGFAVAASAQTTPIHPQDPAASGSDQGPSGWVQAPIPRGLNANQKPAQGAQGAAQKPVAVGNGGAAGHTEDKAGQMSSGDNPGTPVPNPLPGPSGAASPQH